MEEQVGSEAGVIATSYFPNIQMCTKWFRYNELYLEAHENYQKRGMRNTTSILTYQGPAQLTVPLRKGKNQQQSIQNVLIAYDYDWVQNHQKSLQSAYGKSPFYFHYREEIFDLLERRPTTLWELNQSIIEWLFSLQFFPYLPRLTANYKRAWSSNHDWRGKCIWPKIEDPDFTPLPYSQVPQGRLPFQPNMSILDLIFCYGPETTGILIQSFSTH